MSDFSNYSHSFDTGIAAKFGDANVAIVLSHIIFWLRINKSKGVNQIEGKTWMYETLEVMASQFEYLSIKQVRHCIEVLVDSGMIVKGNFNKNTFDRTCWYSLSDETPLSKIKSTVSPVGQIDMPEKANRSSEKGKSDLPSEANDLYIQDKKKDQKINTGTAPKVASIFVNFGSHVKLKENEVNELYEKYGKAKVESVIEDINDYCSSKGKFYKDYASTIRSWIKRNLVNFKNENSRAVLGGKVVTEFDNLW